MKIFVLDDMKPRLDLLKEYLPGCQIDWADNFEDGVLTMVNKPYGYYDFIFLDHDLDDPNGNGVDFVKIYKPMLNRKQTVIWSMNLEGGAEMAKLLHKALHLPFEVLSQILLRIRNDIGRVYPEEL